ncbi:hypothetical protein ARMGADRAFT_1017531 [Armillaria gallica]|uniref:Uncharacterized protein n=1 Tax=Armillaria gallica TaxID=47427 RepID=A0A2H3CXU6_ARMGA|nr:hypothetical protein ARMGADRAFT_1017531 [Armillaria gallica]
MPPDNNLLSREYFASSFLPCHWFASNRKGHPESRSPFVASSTAVYRRDKMRECIACTTVDCGTVETGLPANRPILRLKAAVPGNTRSK